MLWLQVHAAFAAIHGTPRLTVSMDRINVKPPVREGDALPWGGEYVQQPLPLFLF